MNNIKSESTGIKVEEDMCIYESERSFGIVISEW